MAERTATEGSGPADVQASRERRLDARRNLEAIVDAARRTFAADPGASMQQVAVAAGLHRATVHRHFASRDELVDALRRRAFEESLGALRDAHTEQGPAIDGLRRATLALLAVADRWQVARYAGVFGGGPAADEMTAIADALIRRGQEERTIRSDVTADQLATLWGGTIASAVTLRDRGMDVPEIADVLTRVLAVPPGGGGERAG
jgi:AcrR family transcriptional regulator